MSNDQTKDDLTTQPTLETLLERIDAVASSIGELRADMNRRFDAVDQRFEGIDQRFSAVDKEIANLRKDVERGFRGFERKLGYLANELVLQRRAEQDEIFERIEALENKAS
jgi:uncharacterized coiled-coil DUF342 family protein